MNAKEVLEVSVETIEDGVCVSIRGDVDLGRSPLLRKRLFELVTEPGRMVVDLAAVPYMDSSGVATLVETLKQVNAYKGKLVLCCMQAKVSSIFTISRLDTVFTIVADRKQAMQA